MFKSSDSGANWDTLSNNAGFPAEFPRISDIGVRPSNSNYVYATFTGYTDGIKVLYSSNSGESWTNISYDLPNIPIWSIEVDASNNVYIGTDIGVYFKSLGASIWEPFYNSLPNAPVSDLSINETSNQLLASTFGRGIWKTELHSNCLPDIVIDYDVLGKFFETASNSVSMNGSIIGGVETSVVLRSENFIDLEPGFSIDSKTLNKFHGYIGDCDDGIPNEHNSGPPKAPFIS